jgi:hypothetical protein
MPGWFERNLDRELGPASRTGPRAVRDPWLKDWPLLLGLLVSAALILGSMAVRGSDAAPAATPKAAASPGSGISGEVVDVGDGSTASPATGGARAAKPVRKKKRGTPSADGANDAVTEPKDAAEPVADPGSSTPSGGSTPSQAPAQRRPASRGGSRPDRGGSPPTGGGGVTPGKIVNVTGTSAAFSRGPLSYSLRAPTHTPVVGQRWVLSIAAKRSGAPLTGQVKVDILHNGTIVGHAASGPLRNGRFAHKFDWPERSVGHPLTVKTTIVGGGLTQSFLFNVKVKSAG